MHHPILVVFYYYSLFARTGKVQTYLWIVLVLPVYRLLSSYHRNAAPYVTFQMTMGVCEMW